MCSKLLLPPDLQAQNKKAEREREAERKREAERWQQMEDRIRGYEKAEKEWEAERERAAEKLQKMENRARRCEEKVLRRRKRLDEGKQQSHSEVRSSTACALICGINRGVSNRFASHPQGGHYGGGFQQQDTRSNWAADILPMLGTVLVVALLAARFVLLRQ